MAERVHVKRDIAGPKRRASLALLAAERLGQTAAIRSRVVGLERIVTPSTTRRWLVAVDERSSVRLAQPHVPLKPLVQGR